MTTALVAFGGANAGVVAAVLIYRFLTVVPTLVLGGWRRSRGARTASGPESSVSRRKETRARR